MIEGPSRERFWNLPNALTLLRIVLVPVFVLMILQRRPLTALIIIFLAGLTDVLDGMAARALGLRTRLGTILDPLADKLLLSTAFIILTLRSLGSACVIPLWLTAAVLARDFVILAGAMVIYRLRGPREFPPAISGKVSTVFQVATVFWVILCNSVQTSALGRSAVLTAVTSRSVMTALFVATLVFTLVSGLQYILKGIGMAFPRKA